MTSNTRGEDRKQALIMAALDIFGEYGLKGATVRMIADKADANIASIPYYFDSKNGLYRALIEYITQQISTRISIVCKDIEPILNKQSPNPDEALFTLQHFMSGMAAMMIETDEPTSWAKIITREQANPTDAFDILYDGFIMDTQNRIHTLIGVYTKLNAQSNTVKIIGHTLMGQMLGFLICREDLLRTLNTDKLTPKHVEQIRHILKMNIQSCLNEFSS
jgi:AcrR family transcriptional regulator